MPLEGWWRGAVLYQVYVRSWRDSDGDGYGDLRGVTEGLDYLEWLGVDGIWLSPTMPSPDQDWGYDVSDYTAVHPELGTMEDLDELVAEAAARDLAVLLDLVPNHTSSRHPWFVEARSSRTSAHRGWYVWADRRDGGPPNNWRDATGAPAWTWDEASQQYYLHNFLESQPDLDWWNPQVHREFERIISFWLDRGVSGFRIDVAHGLYKDSHLRDDPPAPVGTASPFGLKGVYSKNRPEVHAVYREWRSLVGTYSPERVLLGETWVMDPVSMAAYYGRGDELHLAFNFSFFFCPLDADRMRATVEATMEALPPGACPVWCGSNHDDSRLPSRWAGGDARRARLALVLVCTLPGTAVLYYGDELGLGDVDVPAERQRDPMSWHGKAVRINRDRARTPMPWAPGPGLGFTRAGVEPWLPFGDRDGWTVAEERDDPASTLSLVRSLIRLKHRDLTYRTLPGPPGTWCYTTGRLTVAANFDDADVEVELPGGTVLSSLTGRSSAIEAGSRALRGCEALIVAPG